MSDANRRSRLLDDIRAFVRIPSRSSPGGGEEGALQAVVAERMRGLGARVRVFEADDAWIGLSAAEKAVQRWLEDA